MAEGRHVSRHDWHETALRARQCEAMATTWVKRAASANTGSGQVSAHSPHSRHSPAEKSREGRPATSLMMAVGQTLTHSPQPEQLSILSALAPGGTMRQCSSADDPPRKRRLEMALLPAISTSLVTEGAWWTEDDLVHPNQEAIASDKADGDHRPDPESQDEEHHQLGPSSRFACVRGEIFRRKFCHASRP